MPDAILRAGPFASTSNYFLNEPSPYNGNMYPVNCANTTSSSAWPWKYNESISKTLTSHTGCEEGGGGEEIPTTSTSSSSNGLVKTATGNFSISGSASSNRAITINVILGFAYQAKQSFNIKVTFNASVSGDSTLSQQANLGFLDTFNEDTGPIEGFPSLSNSVTRTLVASTVPAFYTAQIFLDGASIDFPSNICIPNTNTVSVSTSLALEFL